MDRTAKFEELDHLLSEIERSEGERVSREILNIQSSLRLVRRNYEELVRTVAVLQQEKATLQLHDITKRHILDEAFELVPTWLYNFLAAAFGLVDHMRRHRTHLYGGHQFNSEINAELRKRVLAQPHHGVAQGLRGYCLHVSLPPIRSRVVIGRSELTAPLRFEESVFYLPSESLLRWGGWTAEARATLGGMPNGVAILPFVTDYFHQVESFYTWLWGRQAEIHKPQLDALNALKDKARAIHRELNPDDPRLR